MNKLVLCGLLLPGLMFAALDFSAPVLCCDAISEWWGGQAGAIGPNNELYAAWYNTSIGSQDGGIYFARSLDTNQTWSSDASIHFWDPTWIHSEYRYPKLVPDGDSLYCIYWVRPEHSNNQYHLYCSRSDDRGASWNIFEASISGAASGEMNGHKFVFDDDGNIHLLFATRPSAMSWARTFYCRSNNGGITFSSPVMLPTDTSNYSTSRPSPLVTSDGSVLVATDRSGRTNTGVMLYETTDQGATWDTVDLFPQLGEARYPTLRHGRHGALHLFFEDANDALKHSRSEDGGATWSTPFTIVSDNFSSAFAADGDRLIAAWTDASSWDPYHRISEDGGQTWAESKRIWLSHPLPGDWLSYDVHIRNDIVTLTVHNEPGSREGAYCSNAEWMLGINEIAPGRPPMKPGLTVTPNPFSRAAVLRAPDSHTGPRDVDILNSAGRVVTTLRLDRATTWSGIDAHGNRLPAGVYLACTRGLSPARLVLAD